MSTGVPSFDTTMTEETRDAVTRQALSYWNESRGALAAAAAQDHLPVNQYLRHRCASTRPDDGARDLGVLEAGLLLRDGLESGSLRWWSTGVD